MFFLWSEFKPEVNFFEYMYKAPSFQKFRICNMLQYLFLKHQKKSIFAVILLKSFLCDIEPFNFSDIIVLSFCDKKCFCCDIKYFVFATLKAYSLRHWKPISWDIKKPYFCNIKYPFVATSKTHLLCLRDIRIIYATFKSSFFCGIKKPIYCDIEKALINAT